MDRPFPVTATLAIAVAVALAVPTMGRAAAGQPHATGHPRVETCLSATNSSVAPPPGFDPVAASDTDLACYGFPPRPTDPEKLTSWTRLMGRAKRYVGGPVWAKGPAFHKRAAKHYDTSATQGATAGAPHVGSNNVIGSTTDAPADAWSGYSAWQKYNPQVARFDFTGAGWSVPRVADGVPGNIPPGIMGIWTGMGGVADCPAAYTQAQGPDQCLLQAGTLSVAHDLQGDPIHYDFFWEDYPDTPNYCDPNAPSAWGHCIVVKPNDEVYVNVTDNGDGTARFFFEDVTTGDLTNYQTDPRFPLRYLDNSTAEAIVEQNVIQWAFGTQAMYNVSFGYVQAGTANTFVQAGLNAYNDILYYHPNVACPLPVQNLCPNGDGFEDVSNGTEKYTQYCGGYH